PFVPEKSLRFRYIPGGKLDIGDKGHGHGDLFRAGSLHRQKDRAQNHQKNQSQQENSFHLFYLPFTWTRQGTVPCPGSVLGDRGRFPVPVTCGKKPVHQSRQGRSTKVNPSAGVSREQPGTRSRKGTGKSQ